MVPLPWKKVAPTPKGAVAAVTRLKLLRWRDVPRFLFESLRLRRSFTASDGAVAVSLAADLPRREFWTLTVWQSPDAVRAYMRSEQHADAMRRYRSKMTAASSAHWTLPEPKLPHWNDVQARLALSSQ